MSELTHSKVFYKVGTLGVRGFARKDMDDNFSNPQRHLLPGPRYWDAIGQIWLSSRNPMRKCADSVQFLREMVSQAFGGDVTEVAGDNCGDDLCSIPFPYGNFSHM